VLADNRPISGKINSATASGPDQDLFMVQTLATGSTVIRIDSLAFGMSPRVRVLAQNKTTVLYQVDLHNNICSSYLNLRLAKASPGSVVFVEVTDKNAAVGGLYQFSAGRPLASDMTCAGFIPALFKQ